MCRAEVRSRNLPGSFNRFFASSSHSGNDPVADLHGNPHYSRMRLLAALSLTALSACTQVENSFVVEDQQRSVETAKLVLCGSETPLRRRGDQLAVSKVVECEGNGRIELQYVAGNEYECIVGYVTPGAVQTFTYRATKNGCA